MRDSKTKAYFCLARGYSNFRKYRYAKLILRNIFLNKFLQNRKNSHSIIFHEGNITVFDQFFIRLLSFNSNIKFISIKDQFILPENLYWTGKSIFGLGYSLMCRFNYFQVWDFLKNYDVAIRVDDDVLLLDSRELKSNETYICASLYSETHDQTNITFYRYLKATGSSVYYDQRFPPNCFYITRVQFWLGESVFSFLNDVSNSVDSLEERWGDTVVMGVALKKFGGTDPITIDKKVSYVHLSHNLVVKNGREFSISKYRLPRYFLIFRYLLTR
jgi:hypothetical protein